MAAQKGINVGVITSIGGLGDLGFNDLAHDAVKRAKTDLGISFSIVEPVAESDISEFQRTLSETGMYDVIVAVGFIHASPLQEIAREFPDQKYILIDSIVDLPNVTSIVFKEHEGSFLAGVVSAMMTKTNTVGFVGGMEAPLIRRFQKGYEEGVAWANPEAKVLVSYVGSFSDPNGGKNHATSQYRSGADIVYHAAGGSGLGVLDAAEGMKKYAIGVNTAQESFNPGYVVTSMLKRVDNALYSTIERFIADRNLHGTIVFGLQEGGVGLSKSDLAQKLVPANVWAKVDEAQRLIESGKLTVTDAMAQ